MGSFSAVKGEPDMSNVIALNVRPVCQPRDVRLANHAMTFAESRRGEGDVFWLKENAEFLNILEATEQDGTAILDAYKQVYKNISQSLGNYPQYYRFFLSLCLDLEDLGMPGSYGDALCAWVQDQGLPDAELSDLQRAEAERLLLRRNVGTRDPSLTDRLMRFISRPQTFMIPNKKAAYELTHIVFYLSEYGRKDPDLTDAAVQSLNYAGVLAYLDQNFDLLAEICVALRYAGKTPNACWEQSVLTALRGAHVADPASASAFDDYHCYFVASWLACMMGEKAFPLDLEDGPVEIKMGAPIARPLRQISRVLDDVRGLPWERAKRTLHAQLDPEAVDILHMAEESCDDFDRFFAGFARAQSPMPKGLHLV